MAQGPTYVSFYKYFSNIRRLGLVELVREEPLQYVYHERLLSIRMVGEWQDTPEIEVVPSVSRIYRLSALGKRKEMAPLWDDPLVRKLFRQALIGGS